MSSVVGFYGAEAIVTLLNYCVCYVQLIFLLVQDISNQYDFIYSYFVKKIMNPSPILLPLPR